MKMVLVLSLSNSQVPTSSVTLPVFGTKTRQEKRMQKEIELPIAPESVRDERHILSEGAKRLNVNPERIRAVRIRKRSIVVFFKN